MAENMRFYTGWANPPKEALKPIQAGRLKGMSDINPMWRIQALTQVFGPCGIGWWYEVTREEIVDDPLTKQKAVFIDILLYYKDPETGEVSHGIFGTGGSSLVAQERNGPYLSDEAYKMALTDAISVACKALGVASKVYFAADKTKYDQYEPVNNGAPAPAKQTPSEPAAKPEPVTAIVEFKPNPDEVSQELLTALAKHIRSGHKGDNEWTTGVFAPVIKENNGGKNNYNAITDPATRLNVYNALYKKFMEDEKHD